MKILVISSKAQPEYSGSGLRAHNTYKRLKERYGVEYDFVANSVEFNDNIVYEYEGVRVKRIGKTIPELKRKGYATRLVNRFIYLFNFLYQGYHTLRILRTGDYDLIHTFGSSISVNVGILYARYMDMPLLREICNDGAHPQPPLPFNLHRVFKYNFSDRSRVVAISPRIREFCISTGVPKDKVWERPNPVEEARFRPEREKKYRLRKKLTRFDDSDVVMTGISKFCKRKNPHFLLEVLKHLDERFKLLLVGPVVGGGPLYEGDKAYYDEFIEKMRAEDLEDRIQLITTFVDNAEDYIKLSDLYVFPTFNDALGTAMLESIACGVPVVANRFEGVTDYWIRQGRSGFVCELDPARFAECVRKAALIEPDVLDEESGRVLSAASDRVIDEQYFKIMMSLVTGTAPCGDRPGLPEVS